MHFSNRFDLFKTLLWHFCKNTCLFQKNVYNGIEVRKMKQLLDRDLDVSEIVIALKVPGGYGTDIHRDRASHGFAMFSEGLKKYYFDNKTVVVRKNEIVYMPKFSNYKVETIEEGTCHAINFDFPEDHIFEPFVFSPKNPTAFMESFKNAEKAWRTKTDGYVYKCKAELYSILFGMRSQRAAGYLPLSKLRIIAPAIDLIHEKYSSDHLTVSKLAQACDISPEYFRMLFRRNFGISPIKYINDLKLTRAKELLLSGMYSVATAAEMAGYSDISYFSREFRKNVGVPPSEYEG
ncbi:MAG: helix-turn-helix transcriptional regulator [Ruminococcaceae bacterium]|nr:helix-turn-helix transcriptional regulator [Oscillospiraceae bacterium]